MMYLPNYADVRKEKYFVTQQVLQWEQKRKALLQEEAGTAKAPEAKT